MNMTVMMFDNNIYGLTKKQTSPTTPKDAHSFTHPHGNYLHPIKPLSVTLAVANASFVAQTIDWNPLHLYEILLAAHRHQGLSFIRILQRCPHFTPYAYEKCQRDPSLITLLHHEKGIKESEAFKKVFKNRVLHDPSDHSAAQQWAEAEHTYPIGIFYQCEDIHRYDVDTVQGIDIRPEAKIAALEEEMDKCQI